VDRFRFAHALVRDAVLAAVPCRAGPGCTREPVWCSTQRRPPGRPPSRRRTPRRPATGSPPARRTSAGRGARPPGGSCRSGAACRGGGSRPAARCPAGTGRGPGVGLAGPLRPAPGAHRRLPAGAGLGAALAGGRRGGRGRRGGGRRAARRRGGRAAQRGARCGSRGSMGPCTSPRRRPATGARRAAARRRRAALPGARRPGAGAVLPRGTAGAGGPHDERSRWRAGSATRRCSRARCRPRLRDLAADHAPHAAGADGGGRRPRARPPATSRRSRPR
jgi:hypothetical protein